MARRSVVATLGRLADKELVESWMSDPLPIRGGRSRKHFRLTPHGEGSLRHTVSMLSRMLDGLELGDAD